MNERTSTENKLFIAPKEKRTRTSDVIASLIQRFEHQEITLRKLTDRLGDRTFGILLILLAILNVLPFVSAIGGLLVASLGFQMVIGKKKAWLPALVMDRPLPQDKVRSALSLFEPKLKSIERFVRPRLQWAEAPIVDRINGAIIFILGVLIALPIPFTNILPAILVIIMGLGLLERDGFLQIAAAVFGMLVISMIYYVITTST